MCCLALTRGSEFGSQRRFVTAIVSLSGLPSMYEKPSGLRFLCGSDSDSGCESDSVSACHFVFESQSATHSGFGSSFV